MSDVDHIISLAMDAHCDWWFGEDGLPSSAVENQAQWRDHPFDALECGSGLTLYRRDRAGKIDQRDAEILLTTFACRQAGQLIHLWEAAPEIREYLQTADQRLAYRASVAAKAALDQADLARRDAASLMEAVERKVPKLGLFVGATKRAAAWAATKDYTQAVTAHTKRAAAMYAVAAALFATISGTCESALSSANEAITAAGLIAAAEGVIIDASDKAHRLPSGAAEAAGRGAATVNARALFFTMSEKLFLPDADATNQAK